MVAINFPDSPTNGQEHAGYVWDATNNVWNRLPTLPALDLVNFSAVAPSNPQDGQFWFDTTVGKMYVYYNDGSSSQWVSAIGGLASQTGTTGQVLTYDGTEWVADDPSGQILQFVSTTKTDTFSTTSTSYVDVTGLSVSITPSSTSSKIFVMVQTNVGGDSSSYSAIQLVRDSTAINVGDASEPRTQASYMSYNGGTTDGENYYGAANVHLSILDSPATTSTLTYKVQAKTNTSNIKINSSGADAGNSIYGRMASTITLMEVAG